MIKTTVENVIMVIPIFSKLLNKTFNSSDSFNIARLVRELNKELDLFNKERVKLIEKYKDEESKSDEIVIKKEYIDDFNSQINDLIKVEIEINANKILMASFDGVELSINQSLCLLDFVE